MHSDTSATERSGPAQRGSGLSLVRSPDAGLPEDALAAFACEVIRQLASRHRGCRAAPVGPSAREVEEFCTALLSENETDAADLIRRARADGASTETVCMRYLAAAARMLGRWWSEDRTGFMEVTVGTGRMLAIIHELNCKRAPGPASRALPVVFACVPGEHHTLGVSIAAELFRRDGWTVDLETGLDQEALVARIERAPGGILGLSVGGRHSLGALSRLVGALRVRCPGTSLVVSGHGVKDLNPFIAFLDLEGIAADIDEAKVEMSILWDRAVERGGRAAASARSSARNIA